MCVIVIVDKKISRIEKIQSGLLISVVKINLLGLLHNQVH